jgi:hypothetical protein
MASHRIFFFFQIPIDPIIIWRREKYWIDSLVSWKPVFSVHREESHHCSCYLHLPVPLHYSDKEITRKRWRLKSSKARKAKAKEKSDSHKLFIFLFLLCFSLSINSLVCSKNSRQALITSLFP